MYFKKRTNNCPIFWALHPLLLGIAKPVDMCYHKAPPAYGQTLSFGLPQKDFKELWARKKCPFLMVIINPYFPCHGIEMVLLIHLNSTYFKRELSCRWYGVDSQNFVLDCQMFPELLCYISYRNQLWQRSSANKIKLLAFFCPFSPIDSLILKCGFQRLIFSILTSNAETWFYIWI